jgi:hypothetical protein
VRPEVCAADGLLFFDLTQASATSDAFSAKQNLIRAIKNKEK